MNGSAKFFNIL
jgi:hypothetical protein